MDEYGQLTLFPSTRQEEIFRHLKPTAEPFVPEGERSIFRPEPSGTAGPTWWKFVDKRELLGLYDADQRSFLGQDFEVDWGAWNKLGGVSGKALLKQPDGTKWMFKLPLYGEGPEPYAEASGNSIARMVDPGSAVEVRVINLNGKLGTIQKLIPQAKNLLEYEDSPESLSSDHPNALDFIEGHQPIDFLIGNTDAHYGNFLILPNDKVVAVDKGFSFWASPHQLPPSGAVYSDLWSLISKDRINPHPENAERTVRMIEALPEAEIIKAMTPYATRRWPNNSDMQWDEIERVLNRKRKIRKLMDGFYVFATNDSNFRLANYGGKLPLLPPEGEMRIPTGWEEALPREEDISSIDDLMDNLRFKYVPKKGPFPPLLWVNPSGGELLRLAQEIYTGEETPAFYGMSVGPGISRTLTDVVPSTFRPSARRNVANFQQTIRTAFRDALGGGFPTFSAVVYHPYFGLSHLRSTAMHEMAHASLSRAYMAGEGLESLDPSRIRHWEKVKSGLGKHGYEVEEHPFDVLTELMAYGRTMGHKELGITPQEMAEAYGDALEHIYETAGEKGFGPFRYAVPEAKRVYQQVFRRIQERHAGEGGPLRGTAGGVSPGREAGRGGEVLAARRGGPTGYWVSPRGKLIEIPSGKTHPGITEEFELAGKPAPYVERNWVRVTQNHVEHAEKAPLTAIATGVEKAVDFARNSGNRAVYVEVVRKGKPTPASGYYWVDDLIDANFNPKKATKAPFDPSLMGGERAIVPPKKALGKPAPEPKPTRPAFHPESRREILGLSRKEETPVEEEIAAMPPRPREVK